MARRRGLFAVVYIATRWGRAEAPRLASPRGWTRRRCQEWADERNPKHQPRTRYEVRRMPDWLAEIHDRESAYRDDLRERSNASWQRECEAFAEWEHQMGEGLA